MNWPMSEADQPTPGRKGRRRVVAPGTSGQPEHVESQDFIGVVDAHGSDANWSEEDQVYRQRDEHGEWLKAERPPHWG